MIKKILIVAMLLVLLTAGIAYASEDSRDIPVLMYHSIDSTGGIYTVTEEKFIKDMDSLLDAGYTPVFWSEVIDFVYGDGYLPEKPVVITFDDGYLNNYEVAYPIIKEKNMKMEIFTVVGFVEYGSLSFSWDMAREMEKSGHVRIGAHTYNLHSYDDDGRNGVLRKDGEDYCTWEKVMRDDLYWAKTLTTDALGDGPVTFAYPFGFFSYESETLLREAGYLVTVTSEHGVAHISKGDPDSLYLLPRICMDGVTSLASEEIEGHRKFGVSENVSYVKPHVNPNTYASRYDALMAIYRDIPPKTPVNEEVLKAYFDTKYLGSEKSRILALGVNRGVIKGYSDYTLKPDCYITRAEFASMLWRNLSPGSTPEIKHTFPDSDNWNEVALSWCFENGYMVGYLDGTFGANDFLTKEQLEMIMNRIK